MKPKNLLKLKIVILIILYPVTYCLLSLISSNFTYRFLLYTILIVSFIWNMSIMIRVHEDRYNNKYK
jgi:hypothetical protein